MKAVNRPDDIKGNSKGALGSEQSVIRCQISRV
jgi:hypothetical protein